MVQGYDIPLVTDYNFVKYYPGLKMEFRTPCEKTDKWTGRRTNGQGDSYIPKHKLRV